MVIENMTCSTTIPLGISFCAGCGDSLAPLLGRNVVGFTHLEVCMIPSGLKKASPQGRDIQVRTRFPGTTYEVYAAASFSGICVPPLEFNQRQE